MAYNQKYKKEEENSELPRLKAALKAKEPERLYIFFGEEMFLLHNYLKQLYKCTIDPAMASFNFHRLNEENFSIEELSQAVENLPMMAERTMVLVEDIDFFKIHEHEKNLMTEILSDIPDYCTVVFTYETAEWKPDRRQKKLWGAVKDNARIVEFPRQSERALTDWIGRHFLKLKKRIPVSLCSYLIQLTDGNMTLMSGEIEKIAAYSEADEIVKADIDAVTEPVLNAVVFQMTDLLAQRQYGQALIKLQQLLAMQEEPVMILGAIGAQIRRMGTAKILIGRGKSASDLMSLCGISSYPARKIMDTARKFSENFYRRATELILETDRTLKSSKDDPERVMELLILQLAEEAEHG